MKVKVELGHFAEEGSRNDSLIWAKKNYDDYKQSLIMGLTSIIGGFLIIVAFGIRELLLELDLVSLPVLSIQGLIMCLMGIMVLLSMGLLFILFSLKEFIQCKHNSTIAFLKKLHDDKKKIEDEVKKEVIKK